MVSELKIENFKCFETLKLDLKPLNVLMGLNGMGKSTILQSLLLLRQSWQMYGLRKLKLNGRYISLGNGSDILYERADDEVIRFSLCDETGVVRGSYAYVPDSDLLENCGLEINVDSENTRVFLEDGFQYLSAYRIEPRDLYRFADENELKRRDFGNNGELAVHYLYKYGHQNVENDAVIFNSMEDRTLIEQVKCWLSLISPGILPQISVNPALRNTELRYSFREGTENTNAYKSVNVGFGITYVLPVVIALLTAKPGDLLLLENPEAHIHPAGEKWLGELIARASAGGVQILAETHSDHIMNGIRLAIKKNILHADESSVFFFYKDETDNYRHKVLSPGISQDGRIDMWPEGFLDEWDKALLELL